MSKRYLRHKLAYGSAALAVFAVGLFAAGTGSADNGTTTDTTTTEATTTAPVATTTAAVATTTTAKKKTPKPKKPSPPVSPSLDPNNYVYVLPVKAQYGPICKKGDTTGKSCTYKPLPGTLLSVSTLSGKLIRTARTGANGRGKIKLPKGKSKLTFSHTSPYKGYRLGGRTYTVKAPVYMPPPNYFLFTFCVVSDC